MYDETMGTMVLDLHPSMHGADGFIVDLVQGRTYSFYGHSYVSGSEPSARFSLMFTDELVHVPEPSTILLLGSGLMGLAGYGRRRFKK